jgi:hypothetical protein
VKNKKKTKIWILPEKVIKNSETISAHSKGTDSVGIRPFYSWI